MILAAHMTVFIHTILLVHLSHTRPYGQRHPFTLWGVHACHRLLV